MRRFINAIALVACLWSSPAADAADATNVWYGGGSYDGFDRRSATAGVYALCVNNAAGATNVSSTAAWLNGRLIATSNGEAAVVRVYWGTANGGAGHGGWSNTNDFGSSAEGSYMTTNVSVTQNTVHYYRFYATNEAGEAWAPITASFLTPGPPVLNNARGAIPVGATSASLHGNLADGGNATITVYWGQDTNAWSGTNSLGARSQGLFATPAAGLDHGAVYYYRSYGTNAYGECWTEVAAFTTRVGLAQSRGGSYDGYDLRRSTGALYAICVNNAGGPTGVTDSNAWLNGSLVATSNDAPATVRVLWGQSNGGAGLGGWAYTNEFGSFSEGQAFSTNVNVMSNTVYYYRFYATNSAGEGWAPFASSFLTPGPPLLSNARGATPVGATAASLHAALKAGISAAMWIYWGQNTNAWSGTNSLGTCAHGNFVTAVSGLGQSAVYYYRCYGTNAYGYAWSDIVTFTTRLGVASFPGGSYDGYDRNSVLTQITSGQPPGNIFHFY